MGGTLLYGAGGGPRSERLEAPGDSASYDVGVEQNGRFLRIQVKSTRYQKAGSFICNIVCASKKERFNPDMLDFFAVYLVPIDLWYIIPFDMVKDVRTLTLIPRSGHKFSQYMEAWNLLRGRPKRVRFQGGSPRRNPFLNEDRIAGSLRWDRRRRERPRHTNYFFTAARISFWFCRISDRADWFFLITPWLAKIIF